MLRLNDYILQKCLMYIKHLWRYSWMFGASINNLWFLFDY